MSGAPTSGKPAYFPPDLEAVRAMIVDRAAARIFDQSSIKAVAGRFSQRVIDDFSRTAPHAALSLTQWTSLRGEIAAEVEDLLKTLGAERG